MNRYSFPLCLTLVSLFTFSAPAQAKWWIFGQSSEEVAINYLYANQVSFDETGPKIILGKDTLVNGEVAVKGRATATKGLVASVRITLNNKESWKDATVADNGTFEYRFRPEIGRKYIIFVEAMDTSGKLNDLEATRKELVVSLDPDAGSADSPQKPKISRVEGMKHHQVRLTIEPGSGIDLAEYTLEFEESERLSGPWEPVTANISRSGNVCSMTTNKVAQKAILLYYRVRLVKGDTDGPWSEPALWDNR